MKVDEVHGKLAVLIFVVILVLYFIIKMILKEIRSDGSVDARDGNGSSQLLGRGSESDSVEVLVNRIEWSAYLEKRISFWGRALIMTFIIALIISIMSKKDYKTASEILLLFFMIFVPILSVHSFFYTHADVYNDYYIKTNAELLRSKLGLQKYDPPSPDSDSPDRPLVMSFGSSSSS